MLSEYIGQEHLVGQGAPLRMALEQGLLPSLILWGPPGVGKTTLALLLSKSLNRPFFELSAVSAGVKDVREVIESANKQGMFAKGKPVLFIDEIHRFNKSQQDALLGAVEKGVITLIGATTENPSFEVIPALLSRCQVYTLRELTRNDLLAVVNRALTIDPAMVSRQVTLAEPDLLLRYSSGDARRLLNMLELLVMRTKPGEPLEITDVLVQLALPALMAAYDKQGEQHYDLISAFIKSMRGSDPNAALYYLARMLVGGEDILFIARRMVIFAAEDVGLANPNALLLAQACLQSCHQIGMPEARIVLGEVVVYLACAPKSNSGYLAIDKAMAEVRQSGDLAVPLHLRNAPTKLMKELGYGAEYAYAHNHPGHFVLKNYLPEQLESRVFYQPAQNKHELEMLQRLRGWWGDFYDWTSK